MTTPPNPQQKDVIAAINMLSVINKLNLKVFSAKSKKALIFIILNDTIHAIRYNRATLWSFDGATPKLLGVSGQSTFDSGSQLVKNLNTLVGDLQDVGKIQVLNQDSFSKEKRLWVEYAEDTTKPSVLWMPIATEEKQHLGLWLERWEGGTWANQEAEILNFLMQAYAIAWEKFLPRFKFTFLKNRRVIFTCLVIALALLSLRVPLRVVAPCEVVPKDPILITAPLEEIVREIKVKPGQSVKTDDILFEYDKRVATENLRSAQKSTEAALRDLQRAETLGLKDEKSLSEVGTLAAKYKKEQVNLDLAKYRFSQLTVKAPDNGIVLMQDPDEWRGKPTHIGEKIMTLANTDKTKVRIWIPESDNVELIKDRTIKVILNVDPEKTREAKLLFISNVSTLNEKHLPSFVAEADWLEQPKDVKPGLKGSAILYGHDVSVFYWIIRKPWGYFRSYLGF